MLLPLWPPLLLCFMMLQWKSGEGYLHMDCYLWHVGALYYYCWFCFCYYMVLEGMASYAG